MLAGLSARGGVLHRSVLRPPWALRIEEQAPLSVALTVAGSALARFDDGFASTLTPGWLALIATDEHYTVASDLTTPAQVIVRRDGATLPDGTPLPPPVDPVTCTFTDDGSTVLVSGAYYGANTLGRNLIGALPRCAAVRLPHASALLDLLTHELESSAPGRQAALDRWLGLALVLGVRAWMGQASNAPGWWAALADPVLGPALTALHRDPAADWTLTTLAQRARVGRSAFASRFSEVVGTSPMAYVTSLRMDLAADLLTDTGHTLDRIAGQVGYASAFGLSKAFTRQIGMSPSDFRRSRRRVAS